MSKTRLKRRKRDFDLMEKTVSLFKEKGELSPDRARYMVQVLSSILLSVAEVLDADSLALESFDRKGVSTGYLAVVRDREAVEEFKGIIDRLRSDRKE